MQSSEVLDTTVFLRLRHEKAKSADGTPPREMETKLCMPYWLAPSAGATSWYTVWLCLSGHAGGPPLVPRLAKSNYGRGR